MPEGLEAEIWRRACQPLVGRTITGVRADPRVVPPGFADLVVATSIIAVRRRGKVVLVDTDGPTIGLHFGMTGRLEVDGVAPIARLAYASGRDDPAWDRLVLFDDHRAATSPAGHPALRFNDPRRLGRVTLDPDLDHLGVDVTAVTARRLTVAFDKRRGPVKSVLLDQHVVAGLGNLCVDEVLWWAGIAPRRPVTTLSGVEIELLARAIRRRLPVMLDRGGSTTGVLDPPTRAACPPCERDGTPLERTTVGGRTSVWCPRHQR